VSLLTILVSFLAGLVIFPAVFSAGLEPSEGPSLVFVTLPEIFSGIPLASLWATAFFILVALASLTSTISFHEVITAYIIEEFKISRGVSACVTTLLSVALCSVTFFSLFGVDFFTMFDYLSANIMMPLGALVTCIIVMWFMKKGFMSNELTNYGNANRTVTPIVLFMLKYVTPVLIFYIFIKNLL
jgi:NSS family neurotransmitter:Na+ symporter